MSDTYTKLFASITESTIWSEPAGTRLVWITMLAKCNRHGEVFGSIPGLARLANVSLDECASAIETLLAPDRWSRTPDFEGRRIETIDGGWRILNHAKFDRIRSAIEAEERARERKRLWDQENRPSGHARAKAGQQSDESPTKSDGSPAQSVPPPTPTPSQEKQQQKHQGDNAGERSATRSGRDGRRGARLPDEWQPSVAVREWARSEFPAVSLATVLPEFVDYWRSVPGQRGCKLDWDAVFRNRVRAVAARQQQRTPSGTHRESAADRVARINAEAEHRRRGGDIDGEFEVVG